MRFSVIVGNPPYQSPDGGYNRSSIPIYPEFVRHAKRLNPKYVVMIIPARWFSSGKGLDKFRYEMLHDSRIKIIHDFIISKDCFKSVDIEAGVCYFLWDRDYAGDCKVYTHLKDQIISVADRPLVEDGIKIFIRYNEAISILNKIHKLNEPSFKALVSECAPFGLRSYVMGNPEPFSGAIKLYRRGGIGYVSRQEITKHIEWVDQYKVLINKIYGGRDSLPRPVLKCPFLAGPNSVCTETYLCIAPTDNKQIAENVISYIKTKFFRFLVMLSKSTQQAPRGVYEFVPMQDFTKPWIDAELYQRYGLSPDEVAFIEAMVRPVNS